MALLLSETGKRAPVFLLKLSKKRRIERLTIDLVKIMSESYDTAFKTGQATSVSNHFKTDNKYYESILGHFVDCYSMTIGEDIKAQMDIFLRYI